MSSYLYSARLIGDMTHLQRNKAAFHPFLSPTLAAITMLRLIGLFLVLATSSVRAFPTGAGSCAPGTEAILTPGFVHATNAQVGTGLLSDKGLVLLLNGTPLAEDGTSITVGQAYQISINSTSGDAFRGFLMRLDGNGILTDIALNPTDGDDLAQVSNLCVETYLVGGLTHTSNTDKKTVVGTLQMNEAAEGMTLDVTVVVRNSESADVSEWYFTSYAMNAVESTSGVTPVPVAAATNAPTSPSAGTAAPTATTTASPTNSPVSNAPASDSVSRGPWILLATWASLLAAICTM
jgi:hypothetical protein